MIRFQAQLTEAQARRLRSLAADHSVSVSELVRRGVDLLLGSSDEADPERRRERARAVIGRFSSGLHDVSETHDRHLEDLYRS